MNSITMENAEKFIAAVQAMPTRDFLKTMVNEASIIAQARAARRPADMGATPTTSGLHSTGNVPTKGRGYYQRGKGGRHLSLDGKTTSSKKRSEKLQLSWRRLSSLAGQGMTSEVVTSVSYAGHVQGGEKDDPNQSYVMDVRGWETVDEVAKYVEDNIGRVINRSLQTLYDRYFA